MSLFIKRSVQLIFTAVFITMAVVPACAKKNSIQNFTRVLSPKISATLSAQVEREVTHADVEKRFLQHATKRNIRKATPSSSSSSVTPKSAPPAQGRQQKIIQALQKVIVSFDDLSGHVLMWNQFFAANHAEVSRIEKRNNALQPELDIQEQILKNAPVSTGYKRPDYGVYARQTPYIYLADASGHGVKTIVNEVKQVLHSVRRFNPQARILLALEFASMQDPQPPIRFAGQENDSVYIFKSYAGLVPVADELDIDILALDDAISGSGESLSFIKTGNYLVVMNNEDHPGFVQNPLDLTNQEWSNWDGFISISPLGMRFRNEQWANYINAVKSFYDIIIVYAGNAHINHRLNSWKDVPELVGEKYITFNFYAAEKQSEKQQEFENTADEQLNDSHSRVINFSVNLKKPEKAPLYSPHVWGIKTRKSDWHWYGEEFWYLKTTKAQTDKYIHALPVQKQHIYRQTQLSVRKAKAEKLELIEFDVFLPKWPKNL